MFLRNNQYISNTPSPPIGKNSRYNLHTVKITIFGEKFLQMLELCDPWHSQDIEQSEHPDSLTSYG